MLVKPLRDSRTIPVGVTPLRLSTHSEGCRALEDGTPGSELAKLVIAPTVCPV